jgi:hypothetical protein
MIILKSWIQELNFAQTILDIRNNTRDRLLFLWPNTGLEPDVIYRILTIKENFEINWTEKRPHTRPFFMINPPKYEEWINNIEYRMSGDIKKENAVLLIDDIKSSGTTIRTAQEDLIKSWYNKEYIFSYALHLNISRKHELCDSDGNEITINHLLQLLKK